VITRWDLIEFGIRFVFVGSAVILWYSILFGSIEDALPVLNIFLLFTALPVIILMLLDE
jgi:hypothetical protein